MEYKDSRLGEPVARLTMGILRWLIVGSLAIFALLYAVTNWRTF